MGKNRMEARLSKYILARNQTTAKELERELQEAIQKCNKKMRDAYEVYVEEVREEIKTLPKGSKKWWRLNSILLGRSSKQTSSVPPLRDLDGEWIFDNVEKTNLLGNTFEAKGKLPKKNGIWVPQIGKDEQSSFILLKQ